MASVKVAVRVRPINQREINLGSTCIISTEGKKTSITNLKIPAHPGEGEAALGRERVKTFTYDYSYWSVNQSDPQYASQEKVFNDLGQDVLKSAFEGYNACIFAYGQTGSGKSYTMMGEPSCKGLIPRICEGLFSRIKKDDDGISCRTEVSYLEIYCERVRDLLRPSTQYTLRVREHPRDGPYVQDLSKHLVSDYQDVHVLMDKGNTQRTTASTMMNDTSSRSHAIFTITFTQAKFHDDMPSETISKINLVDLAGSERADATGATGDRLKEGANINKSLVTLGNVISALADMSSMVNHSPVSTTNKRKSMVFIPYRDSVLTWLLKDSLGGNSKTIMVATISPADVNYGETLSTLRYANRAKNIINKPTINEDPNVRLIRQLRAEIARLKACLTGMELTDLQTVDKLQENEARVKMLTEEWATKWKETQKIMKERTLALRSEGMGVVLDSDLPHLIGVDDDLLSTGLKLYHIKEGNTTIGHQDADHPCDIVLFGADVQDKHCWLSNKGGIVSLHPIEEAVCSVNGTQVRAPLQLTQGCIVGIGETNLLRFNHPEEAKRLRRELKSKSMNDLSMYRSTENLLAATLRYSGAGMERKHKEEWDKLELKRIEIQKLEEKFKVAESHRQEFQKKGESDLEAQQQQIEQMRQQWQQAQHKATQAEQELEEERKKRHRQNRDILKQLEEYNREKERQCQEFQERLEQLDRQREDSERQCREMAIALESEREQTEKRAEEERQRLAEMEQKQEKILLEREEELAEERVKLEDLLREEREKFQAELAKLEEKEAEMEENLEKAKQDLQRQQEQVQRERDEEHHFLEIEREKLEALKAKHEVARQLAKTMDDSVKAQLAMENQQVAEAWANFDKLKQRQLDTIEEAEKSIQAKAENRVAEIWQSRTELEDKKAELGRRKTENERAMKAAMSEEEKRDLRQELERIVAEEKRITTEELSLEAREADVEKDIEAEFVELEKQKRRDESILEAEWNNLLRIEAANLHYLEQELSDRKAAMEKQKQKLNSTDEHLKQFNMTRSRTLSSFTKEDAGIKDKKEQLQELLQTKECSIQDELSALEEGRAELKARKGQDSEEMGEQRRLLEEALAAKSSLLESEEELKRETAKLTHLVEQITREKQGLEELLQTESFSESRFKEEQRKLNEKMEGLKHLEEQTKEKESDLIQQREEFEKERQAERALIEAERAHLQELENQERISKLVEETVKQRLLEERSERDEQLRRDQERERLERERQLEQLKRDHSQEMEELRKQIKKRSDSYGALSLQGNGEFNSPPKRRYSVSSPITPHTETLRDPILISIPSHMLRGHGWDAHYVFEVHIQVLDEKWQIYRRYSKFRELHDYMKQKIPAIRALSFPPKKIFTNWSEKAIARRRGELEVYLRNFISVCLKNPSCPLSPGPDRVLSKQTLCDFATFFRKGAFETTKYGTG